MRAIRPVFLFLLGLIVAGPSFAQTAEPVLEDAVTAIRKHGLEQSQVMDIASWLTDVYGPRLTGSPELDAATEWAAGRLKEMGLSNVHTEAWGPFGRGWTLNHFSATVESDVVSFPVIAYPKAWSTGTNGPQSGEVVYVNASTLEEFAPYAGTLSGKIVLIQEPRPTEEWFGPLADRHDAEDLLELANADLPGSGGGGGRYARFNTPEARARRQAAQAVTNAIFAEKPLAILDRSSKGDYGTIFVSGAQVPAPADAGFMNRPSAYNAKGVEVIPQMTVAVEQYNRIIRILEKGIPMTMDLEIDVTFDDTDPMEYNLIGEIPGTDPQLKNEVVMVGAHFDSWHAGTGATDNASGSAVMMEAMRILQAVFAETGMKPRRTIRIGLWTGEEQGLIGSRAYVNEHFAESEGRGQPPTVIKPEHETFSVYYNYDNGTGKIRGVYQQGNEAVTPIFREWLKPFHDLGASTLSVSNTGGTDHLSFDGVGLPGFQFIQEPIAYSTRTHHSNMDVYDHLVADDLKQSATIIASFLLHSAQRDAKMPRKPMPAPAATSSN